MKIKVTQDDINIGTRKSSESCPIAQACMRLGFHPSIGVCRIELHCNETGEDYQMNTPAKAVTFIQSFDQLGAEAVAPFEFEIDLPGKGEA